jgi:hypothetical protein
LILSSLLYLGVVLCGMALIALIVLGEGARRGGEPLPRALDRVAHALAGLFVAGAALLVWSDAGDTSPLLDRGGLGLALETWPQADQPLPAGHGPVRLAPEFAPAGAPTWSGDLSGLAAGLADADAEPTGSSSAPAPERAAASPNPIAAQPARVAR